MIFVPIESAYATSSAFLLVINSNFGPILQHFWVTRVIGWKLGIFPTHLSFGAPAPYVVFGISRWS